VLWITLAGWPSLLALIPGLLAVICHLWWIPRLSAQLAPIQFNLLNKVASAVSDYGRAADLLKLTDPAAGPLAEFNQASAQFTGMIRSRVNKVSTAAALASAMLQAVCTFAIGYSVVMLWQPPATDAGQLKALCAVLLFSLAIVTPALRLGHGLDYVAAGRAAAWRLADFLHIMPLQQGEQQFKPTAAPTLQLIDLGWQSQGKMLFQNLSTSVQAGHILAITGRSGAGKSTLLRLIAGLENLQNGTVLLADQALACLTAASRQQLILLMPQGLAVMPGTVQQNLALTAPDASTTEYQQALHKAQLNTELSADAALFSGGEKQRLNLARVFLAKATVLLLDEPTSGLDPQTSLAVLQALIAHVRQHSCFLLLVTHQPEYAAMADLQLVLPTDGKEDKT
jgi:ABC-type transport system involved in cytochrome bd biosynthesis fused ATPase/permease subunit